MSTVKDLQPVIEKICRLPKPTGRPLFIAISGFGGSGKTTIADKLASLLPSAYVVHVDDFIFKDRALQGLPKEVVFDRKRLTSEVLEPISQGRPASYRIYKWDEEELGNPLTVPPIDFLIVEGISAYHPDIAGFFDIKTWIDTDLDIATARGRTRDEMHDGKPVPIWDTWKQRNREYFETYRPRDHADFIFPN